MKQSFHSLLADFLKTAGLQMELPSAEDLESFELELEGTSCVVFPNADGTLAAARVFVQRFDAIPIARRSTAMRLMHSLNHQTQLETQTVATIDVDDRIFLSKVFDTRHTTGDQLAADLALLFEAASDLRQSLGMIGGNGGSSPPTTESVTHDPIHFA
jgi:hypothetical protein